MREYELIVEHITPCGGEAHARREILEVQAESPRSYVLAESRYPILEELSLDGGARIITGDSKGYVIRYTFAE